MPTIHDILKFHFSHTTLTQSAKKVIPLTLEKLNEHRIDKLEKITNEVGSSSFTFSGSNLIPEVFRKFKRYLNDDKINFNRRELRTLSYSLYYSERSLKSIFSTEEEFRKALNLFNSNWRDSYLLGLIDCFLKKWNDKTNSSIKILENFIFQKLENYTGNRKALVAFKDNKRFFNLKNGDLLLGDTLARQKNPIQDATKVLSVPDSWFTYPYFSKVIVSFYEGNKENIYEIIKDLNEALVLHNNSITNKRLISKIIIQAIKPEFANLRDEVKSIAFKQIGDPANSSNWSIFDNATETERRELKEARKALNEWITQQFINVFFKVCINDERRKHFWLKFSSKISTFQVYGPKQTKYILEREENIADYVDAKFKTVSSNRDVSAFILYIENYMLIEFSNEGYAFYAYEINSPNRPDLTYGLRSVDNLRNGSMPMAIQSDSYYYYYNDEGRLTHRDGNQIWEAKFNDWLNKKVFK